MTLLKTTQIKHRLCKQDVDQIKSKRKRKSEGASALSHKILSRFFPRDICFCAPGGRRRGKENKGKGKIYEKKGEGQRKGGGFSLRKEKKGKRKVYDKRKEKDKEKEVGFLSD